MSTAGIYSESGLRVDLRGKDHFRFQDCPAYRSISGQNLKEMDFGWWDADTLWLLELKDYAHLSPEERLPGHLLEELANKATDVLLMLAAAWIGTEMGNGLKACLPKHSQRPHRLKLAFVLKVEPILVPQIQTLKDTLNQRLRGRIALFDIRNVILIDHLTAIKYDFLPLAVA